MVRPVGRGLRTERSFGSGTKEKGGLFMDGVAPHLIDSAGRGAEVRIPPVGGEVQAPPVGRYVEFLVVDGAVAANLRGNLQQLAARAAPRADDPAGVRRQRHRGQQLRNPADRLVAFTPDDVL